MAADTVFEAIRVGYRHLDNACDYGNEEQVGEGIRRAIAELGVRREDLFVVSKLWNTFHAAEHVRPACERTLRDLGLDYVDLYPRGYLIHFPIALKYVPFETRYPPEWVHDPSAEKPVMELAKVPMHETWGAMEALVDAGLARNIGISNMGTYGIRDILSYARIRPAVLQVERHVYLRQPKLLRYCEAEGIHVTGFSPLGAGSYVEIGTATDDMSALRDPVVKRVAERVGRSAAQVLLRWAVQRGCSVIPKSTKPERLAQNLALFDFELSEDDMASLDGLDAGRRFNDPGVYCEFMGVFCPIYE